MNENTINADVTLGGSEGTLLANRYRVIRQLGQGGMGSVWLAADAQLDNREVAIKMLPSILVSNKRAYNQLKSEALVSLKLTHPNIAAVRAFEENGGNPFLVVDYIDGQTLDDYLLEKCDAGRARAPREPHPAGLPESEVIRLLTPIAAALDYAHSKGVVHRDVKPGNVMIAKDGTPYILDFGIAREIQETMTRVTGKLSSGTLMYMSPEQLHGAAPKSSQDVYSFAAMAYECLMGTPPFSRGQIEYQIEHDVPAPLGHQFAMCGPGIMSGLAKRPESRPSKCSDVLKSVQPEQTSVAKRNVLDHNGANHFPVYKWILIALLLGASAFLFWWKYESKRLSDERVAAQEQVRADAREKARNIESQRLAEQVKREQEAREKAERERKNAEEELKKFKVKRDLDASVRTKDAAQNDSSARRVELSELFKERTLIDIKRDRGEELVYQVEIYRKEKDGFETHLLAFDAAHEKLKGLTVPKSLAEGKTAAAIASACVDTMALELKWLQDNKKGRDDAKRIEAEIVNELDEELKRFKAEEVATSSFAIGHDLRCRGNKDLVAGDFAAAGRSLSAAKDKLGAALAEAKGFYVSLALSAAKQRKDAGQWEKCLAECEKALIIDKGNTEAKTLSVEANEHLVPTMQLIARIGTREVSGATAMIDKKLCRTPISWNTMRDGMSVGGYRFSYTENGRKYVGKAPRWTVDWRGRRTMIVDLREYKGPSPGDVKTVKLPDGVKLELVWCPPGIFMMGSPSNESGRANCETYHQVRITKGFWIGKYEITQAQWESVMNMNPSEFNGINNPVEQVSWDDCVGFCRRAGLGLRLPTEAEWEYACRAGSKTAYFWGDTLNGDRANCDGTRPYGTKAEGPHKKKVCEVGSYRPNAWGIYDMHGNVCEWCADWSASYDAEATDPEGPAFGVVRVNRGGSWFHDATYCRSANRRSNVQAFRENYLGFRVCCSAGSEDWD